MIYKKMSFILNLIIFISILKANLSVPLFIEIAGKQFHADDLIVIIIGIILLIHILNGKFKALLACKQAVILIFITIIYFMFGLITNNKSQAISEMRGLMYWLIIPFAFLTVKSLNDLRRLLKVILLASISFCILYLWTYFNESSIINNFLPDRSDERLLLSTKAIFILFPFFIAGTLINNQLISSKFVWVGFVLSLSVILLSGSRFGIIVVSITSIIMIYYVAANSSKLKISIFIAAAIFILGTIPFIVPQQILERYIEILNLTKIGTEQLDEFHSAYSRIYSYELIFQKISRNYILGYGLGAKIHNLNIESFEYYVDSSYLLYWFKMGILGLFGLAGLFYRPIKNCALQIIKSKNKNILYINYSVFFSIAITIVLSFQDMIFYSGYTIAVVSVVLFISLKNKSILEIDSCSNQQLISKIRSD